MAWTPGRTQCTQGRTGHTGTSSAQHCTLGLPWDEKARGEAEMERNKKTEIFIYV